MMEQWRALGDESVPEPPVPLILGGAAFSSAREIRARWAEYLDWAVAHGFMDLLMERYQPPEGKDYAERTAGVAENSRGWWPDSTYWNSDPRTRPTSEQLVIAFVAMQSQWINIAGDELARYTRPIAITGKKKRRLAVAVDANYSPKWGSWTSFEADPAAFRDFRSAVNAVIKPVEVDHIDFVVGGAPNKWKSSDNPAA